MTASIVTKVKFLTLTSTLISTVGVFAALNIGDRAEAIVVSGNPNNYLVSPGTGYDGVVRLSINRTDFESVSSCTGSLLPTGLHILTAAHCLTQDNIGSDEIPGAFVTKGAKVFFDLPTETSELDAAEFYVNPLWNGNYDNANDVAVIKLAGEAPPEAERYDLYRGSDEIGQIFTKVGYGRSGNGNTGRTINDGRKRYGQNTYDAVLGGTNARAFGYDFDNGLATNDAIGTFSGTPNTGLGLNEVFLALGDSGGPNFINGSIAGITSFIRPPSRYGLFTDIDNINTNSTFGEIGFDTRVSSYASYIDSVLAGAYTPVYKVPEPSTVVGTMFALGTLAMSLRLKRKVKEGKGC
ncbi:MAG: S1 family peptidase [Scytonema hyalinum WJT4-NPBG1]|jgi:secreted trypsin-like serine protease|nr:S1 family peptidase [Scytonema hyalinum WJT4-NPBG1]